MSRKTAAPKPFCLRSLRLLEPYVVQLACCCCGKIFPSRRRHAKTCSPACRKRLSRYMQEQRAMAAIWHVKRDLFRGEV